MAKAASRDQCIKYAALLVRETARVRGSAWTSQDQVIDAIYPLMDAFVGAYVTSKKHSSLKNDLTRWLTKEPEVLAAFKETCAPEAQPVKNKGPARKPRDNKSR